MNARKHLVALLAMTVALSFLFQPASAQPDAGAKARGEFNFYGRGARSAMRGARESTGSFREYVRGVQPRQPYVVTEVPRTVVVSPQIARAAADEIGDYIAKSERHLAWMRRQAEAGGDKETLASLDIIDQNLAAAKKNHATLCDCCAADHVNPTAAMACCQSIDESLAKAISEHDALMKRLGEK